MINSNIKQNKTLIIMIFLIIGIAVFALIIFNIYAENKKRSGDYIMKKFKETGEIPYTEPSSNDKPSYGDENSNDF